MPVMYGRSASFGGPETNATECSTSHKTRELTVVVMLGLFQTSSASRHLIAGYWVYWRFERSRRRGGRLRAFEGRLFSRKQGFFAPSCNTLLWQDFPFQRNSAVGVAQAMKWRKGH